MFVEGVAKPWLVPEVKQVLHSGTFILPSRQRMQKPAKQNQTGVVPAKTATMKIWMEKKKRQTDRQTDRQAGRQTGSEGVRESERQTDRE